MTGITKSVVIVLLGSSDQLIHYLVPSNSLQALLPEIQLLHTASLPSPDTPPRIGRILQLLEAIFFMYEVNGVWRNKVYCDAWLKCVQAT